MSIQPIISSNINQLNQVAFKNDSTSTPVETVTNEKKNKKNTCPPAPNKVRIGVLLTTAIGVCLAMDRTFRVQGLYKKFNLKEFATNFTKVKYQEKNKELEWLITRLAAGSVGGGLAGGLLLDKKENRRAKYREAVIQLIGNIFIPMGCVAGTMHVFQDHFEPKLLDHMKFLKSKTAKGTPGAILAAASVITGLVVGNHVGNIINEKIFKVNDKREIKMADLSPQLDDACMAVGLVAPNNIFGDVVKRFIPLALMIAGYSVGTAQRKPDIAESN